MDSVLMWSVFVTGALFGATGLYVAAVVWSEVRAKD